ncbi:Trk system potassium transporter TrkA [Oceanibaculum pacificum]|uniref:Trk system potassium uptake protein TrkA n=1 Tax=Oceanibaculum pacificum TaxID=580166 RepID=A0A154W8D9_9PROT|nr:Trk system potassium transporter TrkA [Oceanibaculum pacificum]KZD09799.1 potassium transporter TrkA [Oceanibaculum pacificum]
MNVIVCGAGQVGSSIARYLSAEGNDVTVIDQSADLIRKISDTLDVRAFVGHASHPGTLEMAGAKEADMLIAVTYADEVNMVACQVGHSLFQVPTKIARIRSQNYLMPEWADLFSRDNMPIDVIISPEVEVARHISQQLQVPGAFDMLSMVEDRIRVVGVMCDRDCPVLNTPMRQLASLFPDLNMTVVSIIRNDRVVVPSSEDQMLVGDEVYFVCDTTHLARAMAAFGHQEPEARRIVIVGAGNIGLTLAQTIEAEEPGVSVKMIEVSPERARAAAGQLNRTMVLNGSALDPEILEEANIRNTETFVSVTNDDEVNIIGSLLAKRYGCERAVTLINNQPYGPLVTALGVDAVVNPRSITVSTILQHVRRGRIRAVHSLREGVGEVIEAEALETSNLVGVPLREAKLPNGIIIGALVRGENVIMPRGDTRIQAQDRVVAFVATEAVKKVEKLFSVRLEYF